MRDGEVKPVASHDPEPQKLLRRVSETEPEQAAVAKEEGEA